MRNSVIWSFFSLVALASGGLISGCDSDDATIKSALGESCNKTADCNDGLKCIQGTCYQSASSSGGSANQGGDSSGGTTVVSPPKPVLGTEGESCTKRADCQDGLGCYSGRCTAEATGEGGAAPVGPRLGQPGETCVVGSDCEKGLICIPGGVPPYEGGITGAGYIGVCSVATSLKPSGKSCGGAECREAKDCCELPLQLHVAYAAVAAPWGTGANSCSELRALLGNAKCSTATGATGAQCAALATYCDCEDDTWSCDAGRCSYQAGCTEGTPADQPKGCPTYTRSGQSLPVTICNSEGACAAEPVEVETCKRDADCEGMAVTADPTAAVNTCSKGECVCHVDSGACYRKCDSDLDCEATYKCDTDTSLCTKSPACTTNEECVATYGYPGYACDEGTCKFRCNSNLDCLRNVGVADVAAVDFPVCGEDNFCAPLGCTADEQCSISSGGALIRMFCTEPVVVEGTAIQSAITD